MKKRFLGMMLAVVMTVMALCIVSAPAFAASSGSCGGSLTYALGSDGVLTISGTGDMADWTYSANAPWYAERDDITGVVISSGVTSIGNYAFYNCENLVSIIIPESVTDMGEYAFYNCTSLANVTIPKNVTAIAKGTFNNCAALTTVTIPNNVKSIGDWAFFECDSLEKLTIGSGVKTIGEGAFSLCAALANVSVPEGVTAIGDVAFWYCASLKTISLPDSLTAIGDYAFNDTAYFAASSNWDDGALYIGNHLIKANVSGEYTVKSGTKVIADYAFSEATKLTSITLPGSLASIGNYAFTECEALTDVYYMGTEAGWANVAIGTDNVVVKNAEMHLVAPKTYTITFDANGGANAPAAQTKTQGIAIKLSTTVPTYNGYVFVSWKDANGKTYAPGDKYTADADATLTAVWKKLSDVTNLAYGDINADGSVTVSDVIVALQLLASDGFDELSAAQKKAADVNCDGIIDVSDAIRMLQYLASPENTHLGPKGMIQFLGNQQGEATAALPTDWAK